MTHPFLPEHPFGSAITTDTLRQLFIPLTQWEDKYRQLILLGKKLPILPETFRQKATEIPGCENRVWLGYAVQPGGRLHFYGDSEGRIVRGLLAILLTSVEGKTAQALQQYDPLALFNELGLQAELSASRTQGLAALAQAVRQAAG